MDAEDEPVESRAERVARLKAMRAGMVSGDGGSGGAAPGEGAATDLKPILPNPLVDGSFGPSGSYMDHSHIDGEPMASHLMPTQVAPPTHARSRAVHDRILKAAQTQEGLNQPSTQGLHPGPFPPPPPPPTQIAPGMGGESGGGGLPPPPIGGYPPPPGGYPPPPPMNGGRFGGGRGGGGRGGGNRGVKRDRGPGGRGGGRGGSGGDDPSAYVKRSMVEDPWAHLGVGKDVTSVDPWTKFAQRPAGTNAGGGGASGGGGGFGGGGASGGGGGLDPQRHRLFDSLDA